MPPHHSSFGPSFSMNLLEIFKITSSILKFGGSFCFSSGWYSECVGKRNQARMIYEGSLECRVFKFRQMLVSLVMGCIKRFEEAWGLALELRRQSELSLKWVRRCIPFSPLNYLERVIQLWITIQVMGRANFDSKLIIRPPLVENGDWWLVVEVTLFEE